MKRKTPSITQNSFFAFCTLLRKINEAGTTDSKILLCSEYLKQAEPAEDLELAAQFMGEGAFDRASGKHLSIGSRALGMAAARFCEIDYEKVYKPCRAVVGNNSETIERLMENIPEAIKKRTPRPFSLADVQAVFEQLCSTTTSLEKKEILLETWERMTPLEIGFFTLLTDSKRVCPGFEISSILSAVSSAFECNHQKVRYVHMITGSLGETAIRAKNKHLHKAELRLFHPLPFMHAEPAGTEAVDDFSGFVAEEMFDGIRAQLHTKNERVKIYSTGRADITRFFPEIEAFFIKKNPQSSVFDGMICVFKNETIMPLPLLQKRMAAKKPGKKIIRDYPVIFILCDLLCTDAKPAFHLSLSNRRKILENLAKKHQLPVSRQFKIRDHEHFVRHYEQAVEHGNSGLILKQKQSVYEYGLRSGSWLKFKKPGDSLDTAIMYAHTDTGERDGLCSCFTLGISVKNDERYSEEFIPIGKISSGFSEKTLQEINLLIKNLVLERFGPTLSLKPELILRVEFDEIRINNRTKAGYTLKSPQPKTLLHNLLPDDASTLRDVEACYHKKIVQKPRKKNAPSFFIH